MERQERRSRWPSVAAAIAGAAAGLAAVGLAGCAALAGAPLANPEPSAAAPSGPTSTAASPDLRSPDEAASDRWWDWLGFGGLWGRSYDSLAGMVKGADIVALGRIVRAEPGRVEGKTEPDGWADRVYYVYVTVEVERVIAGQVPGSEVVVQFISPDPSTFAAQLRAFPSERALFFLNDLVRSLTDGGRRTPDPELAKLQGIYEWTVPGSVVRNMDGVARPLVYWGDGYARALDGRPFDDVVAEVVRLAGS